MWKKNADWVYMILVCYDVFISSCVSSFRKCILNSCHIEGPVLFICPALLCPGIVLLDKY